MWFNDDEKMMKSALFRHMVIMYLHFFHFSRFIDMCNECCFSSWLEQCHLHMLVCCI